MTLDVQVSLFLVATVGGRFGLAGSRQGAMTAFLPVGLLIGTLGLELASLLNDFSQQPAEVRRCAAVQPEEPPDAL